MKTTLLVCFVSCVSLAGCVHTSEIGYETAQTMPEEAFRSVRRQDVLVKLKEAEKVHGMALSVTPDTLLLQEDRSNAILRLPMNRVESIEVAGNLSGPFIGFLWGGVVGGAIGALVGSAVDLESDSGVPSEWFRPSAIAYGAAIGAGVGALLGVTVGGNMTAGRRFVLPHGGIPVARPAETKPSEFIVVIVQKLTEETENTVTIPWEGWEVMLQRSQITITKMADGIHVRVPRKLLSE